MDNIQENDNAGVNKENIKRFIDAWESEYQERFKRFRALMDDYSEYNAKLADPQERAKIKLAPRYYTLEAWIRGKGWASYKDFTKSYYFGKDLVKLVYADTGLTFLGAEIKSHLKKVLDCKNG